MSTRFSNGNGVNSLLLVVVITTAQLHSSKPELRFCAGSNPARGVSDICDGEDLWQWSRIEIRLNAFRRSTTLQKQFIKKTLIFNELMWHLIHLQITSGNYLSSLGVTFRHVLAETTTRRFSWKRAAPKIL